MTSVAPPPPPPPPSGGPTGAQLTVNVPRLPPQIAQLPLESLLTGTLRPPTPQGDLLFQTNLGLLQFKAPFNLPAGTNASFKLLQLVPTPQIQLTHINGKPVPLNTPTARLPNVAAQFMQQGQNGTGQNQAAQNALAQTSGPATNLNVNTATGLRAVVLSVLNPAQSGQQAAQNQTGQSPQITPNTNHAPNVRQSVKTANNLAPASTVTTGQQVNSGTQTSSTTSMFQNGNQLFIRLLSVQFPGQGQTGTQVATPNSAANTVITQGTIQNNNANKQAILHTPNGSLALETNPKMPDGTTVKFEILSSTRPQYAQTETSSLISNSTNVQALAKKWPALEEGLETLKSSNPVLAETVTSKIIPKPDGALAANLIFFLKALGKGNIRNWADDQSLKAIAKAKPDLAKKLENDFDDLSNKAKTPNSTDWKIAYVPIQNNNQLEQIKIAQREANREEAGDKEDPGIRFVIDLELSNIGPIQLDGLAKDKHKKFELLIRTKSALPGFMRKSIHDIFENGMEVINFDGKLTFLVTPNFVEVEGVEMPAGKINLGMLV